jgi:hypothetical protein
MNQIMSSIFTTKNVLRAAAGLKECCEDCYEDFIAGYSTRTGANGDRPFYVMQYFL